MNIKYTLSLNEAIDMLQKHFSNDGNTTVVVDIIPPAACSSPHAPGVSIMEAVSLIKSHNPKFDTKHKVAAIIEYRKWASENGLHFGFVEAKNFVESLS